MMNLHGGGSSIDRISELPLHVAQNILMCLPLEDMVRTSTLSKYWRFQWTKVPQLMFHSLERLDIVTVFWILLQHEGPVFKCSLVEEDRLPKSEVNHVIRYLSRSGIQDLHILRGTLTSSIFSCVELKYLTLESCTFRPISFDGFSKLIYLELVDVRLDSYVSISSCPVLENLRLDSYATDIDVLSVDAPKLKYFYFRGDLHYFGFMCTPLLEVLSLDGYCDPDINYRFNLTEFLCSLHRLQNLLINPTFLQTPYFLDGYYQPLSSRAPPNKLPTMLASVRKLELIEVDLSYEDDLSSILWLMKNSPNLQRLKFGLIDVLNLELEPGLKMQDYSVCHLNKLQELEMFFSGHFGNLKPELEFMKYLLDVSPELEKFYIRPSSDCLDERQSKMVLELACYRRASPKAEIVLL